MAEMLWSGPLVVIGPQPEQIIDGCRVPFPLRDLLAEDYFDRKRRELSERLASGRRFSVPAKHTLTETWQLCGANGNVEVIHHTNRRRHFPSARVEYTRRKIFDSRRTSRYGHNPSQPERQQKIKKMRNLKYAQMYAAEKQDDLVQLHGGMEGYIDGIHARCTATENRWTRQHKGEFQSGITGGISTWVRRPSSVVSRERFRAQYEDAFKMWPQSRIALPPIPLPPLAQAPTTRGPSAARFESGPAPKHAFSPMTPTIMPSPAPPLCKTPVPKILDDAKSDDDDDDDVPETDSETPETQRRATTTAKKRKRGGAGYLSCPKAGEVNGQLVFSRKSQPGHQEDGKDVAAEGKSEMAESGARPGDSGYSTGEEGKVQGLSGLDGEILSLADGDHSIEEPGDERSADEESSAERSK